MFEKGDLCNLLALLWAVKRSWEKWDWGVAGFIYVTGLRHSHNRDIPSMHKESAYVFCKIENRKNQGKITRTMEEGRTSPTLTLTMRQPRDTAGLFLRWHSPDGSFIPLVQVHFNVQLSMSISAVYKLFGVSIIITYTLDITHPLSSM